MRVSDESLNGLEVNDVESLIFSGKLPSDANRTFERLSKLLAPRTARHCREHRLHVLRASGCKGNLGSQRKQGQQLQKVCGHEMAFIRIGTGTLAAVYQGRVHFQALSFKTTFAAHPAEHVAIRLANHGR
jgi:hypothetical protein